MTIYFHTSLTSSESKTIKNRTINSRFLTINARLICCYLLVLFENIVIYGILIVTRDTFHLPHLWGSELVSLFFSIIFFYNFVVLYYFYIIYPFSSLRRIDSSNLLIYFIYCELRLSYV